MKRLLVVRYIDRKQRARQSEVESPFNPQPDLARDLRALTYSTSGREQRDVWRPKHDLVWPPLRPLFRDMEPARA